MPEAKPATQLFALTAAQQERLLACRAAWEEGEDEERLERLRQREEDAETLRAFSLLLADSGFAQGRDLAYAQMARLLALARALAPNPNLDARLLRRPGEPAALNHDLRDLLFGTGTIPLRLRNFLLRRHAGGQTALQLLCAAFPTEWPLVTQAGRNALELTEEQRVEALKEARERYELPEEPVEKDEGGRMKDELGLDSSFILHPSSFAGGVPESDPVLRLLADVILYGAVREFLEAADFVEVHRLLTQGMAAKPLRRRRALAPLLYAPRPDALPTETHIREESLREYEPGFSPTPDAQRLPPAPPDISAASEEELLTYLERYVAAQGFTYPPLTVRDYAISLQTRPFALLSGLSGTGKSRLTSLFAEALTGSADAQYRLLPVRPDWADSTPLLGYVNLLAAGDNGRGRFHSTPFLDFLLRAARPENAYRAYFLCLDEMNLARVEHYFAEILSAMETPTRELLLPDGRAVRLPANLFLTGTLNLDEATHSLSRKVLDRANTISFQEVALRADAPEDPAEVSEPFAAEIRQALFLLARVTTVGAARAKLRQMGSGKADFAARVVETLAEANALLEPHGLHFGYRVRDEVLRYSANSFDRQGRGLLVPDSAASNLRTALDLQMLQKALPRLAGTQEQIETPVRALLSWAEKAGFDRTARRLSRLLARLQRDGFAGFEE